MDRPIPQPAARRETTHEAAGRWEDSVQEPNGRGCRHPLVVPWQLCECVGAEPLHGVDEERVPALV